MIIRQKHKVLDLKKQEVSIRMRNINFNILTLIWTMLVFSAHASIVTKESAQTHLRLNIFTQRDFLNIEKRGERLYLKTLNNDVFQQLTQSLGSIEIDKNYIASISPKKGQEGQVHTVEFTLSDPRVELFSFYRDRESKYVLDFWVDESIRRIDEKEQRKEQVATSKPATVTQDSVSVKEASPAPVKKVVTSAAPAPVELPYRDYRYGASFIWDYAPLAPRIQTPINLERKTAEYFYPMSDRKIDTNDEEAHLQLSINLYRESKWGLMAKSIQLFEKKYPSSKLSIFNEYLKANTLLRENFEKGNNQPVKMAITMYESLAQVASDYEMRKGLYKYLITYFYHQKEYLRALDYAKRFYVETKENFDYEESNFAVEMIFANLGHVNQVETIREVAEDKTLQKIIPRQLILAYETYALLSLGRVEEVLDIYEKEQKGLVQPIEPAILYNTAEAYFRTAQYEKAITLFDNFVAANSHMTNASHARLRIALCYDLLDRDFKQTLELYRNAINRSQDLNISYEARIRYTAMRSVRAKNLSEQDREVRIFLERDRRLGQEVSTELRHLLWLTRLRTFIVDGKFQDALSYLNAIPLASIPAAKRRVFEADGAEIVYGLIFDMFKKADYAKAVQAWDVYKKRYIEKVAQDPFVNFIVGKSYIKLGLHNAFDQAYQRFASLEQAPRHSFPLWVEREALGPEKELLIELQVLRHLALKNWAAAATEVAKLEEHNRDLNKLNYYRGLIFYRQGNFVEAAASLENYLARQTTRVTYDPTEVADMMLSYTDSLYQLKEHQRFRRVAEAILNDTTGFANDNKYMKEVREKVAYLLIENYANEATSQSYLILEPKIVQFKREFQSSVYLGRVNLILGQALINNQKTEDGKKIFEDLLGDESVSDVIKELARSELSLLRIKERTI